MFNLICTIFSAIKSFLSEKSSDELMKEVEEARIGCIDLMRIRLKTMRALCADGKTLPMGISDEMGESIKKYLRYAAYLKDKELDNLLVEVSEVFHKIKYLK